MAPRDGSGDRYLPRRILGEGGAGRVWLVEDRLRPGSRLAMKELAPSGPASRRHAEALRLEFATLSSLRHPNLVEVHEFDTSPESSLPRFTLELIEGRNIVDAVAQEGAGLLVELAAEALRALAFLHDFDLLHRDLKPDNLLVRDRAKLGCRLVLVDFGLAQATTDESLESLQARGTLPYLAPELFANEGASRRTDLYALGAVLYEAVHGGPPFVPDDRDLAPFLRAVAEGRRARPALPPGYPEGLSEWLEQLLAPDPEHRPERASEALARLNEACGRSFPVETPASRLARLLSGAPAERGTCIERIWSGLESPGPRLVWLGGGPGSGKTRVLRWLFSDALRRDWRVFAGDPHPRAGLAELRSAAAERPVLVLIDDADAAGGGLADWMERVAREPDGPPVKLVAALRPGQIAQPRLRRLYLDTETVPTLDRVELGPLDVDGVRAMARRATGGPVSDERVAWLLRASEGSPATAESLLVDEVWEHGGGLALTRHPAELPAARLELLSGAARSWLEALAVLRGGAPDERIAEIAGLQGDAGRQAADDVAALGLAHRHAARWQPDSRALVDGILAGMDPARRRGLHRAAAARLEASDDPTDAWLLARLWHEAGEADRAVSWARRAAELSRKRGDPAEAAARLSGALRFMGRGKAGRAELRLEHANALMEAGLNLQAARAYGAAAMLAGADETRMRARASQALALVQAGRFSIALDVAERAARRARAAGREKIWAQARKASGIALGRLGREREALAVLESARKVAAGSNDAAAEAELLQVLGACRLRLGSKRAEADFRGSIQIHRRARKGTGRPPHRGELKALVGLAVFKTRAGDHDDAIRLLDEVRQTAREQGHLDLQEVALSKLAVVAIEREALDRAMTLAKQAADLALHLGDQNLMLVDHCRLADAQIRSGRPGAALALLQQPLERSLQHVEPENIDYARMLLAQAGMESGNADDEQVARLLEASLARCRGRRKSRALLVALTLEMERIARRGGAEAMGPVAAEFDRAADEAGERIDPETRHRAALARSVDHLARGDHDAARDAAEAAIAAAEEAGSLAFRARGQAVLAEALDRAGEEEAGRAALKRGSELLRQAAEKIADEAVRSDFLSRPAFASLQHEDFLTSRTNHERLKALYDMIRVLNSATDADALLESILDMALKAVRAERGMILLKDPSLAAETEDFSVHLARNLDEETIEDVESFSRSIVNAAGAGQSVLTLDARSDDRFRDFHSVSLYGIRSLMCVPLRLRERIAGTVYLDSRRDGLLFTPDDLRFLEAFADQAALALERTLDRAELERRNRRLQAAAETRSEFANLIGRSPGMQAVFDLIEKVAGTVLPVLIHGESGTGKERVARAIHFHGTRRRKPFVTENCAAIPETLLESELFGHVRGAFTGAERDHPGLFEQANGGTLFLDEIGDMSAAMQARLLRVIEEGELRRVGGEKTISADVRILTATHRDLRAAVDEARFREDLFYRLQVLTIELPPLRGRPGDVELLCGHFLARIGGERAGAPPAMDPEVLRLFESYSWPGNVRELENTIQRLVVLAGRGPISVELIRSDPALHQALLRETRSDQPVFSLKLGEKEQLRRAIDAAGGNRTRAARLLGVSRATLYRKLRQHGL